MDAIAIFGFYLSAAQAESFSGKVVGIADGDTLTVLTASKQQYKIRLAEIDAPEKHQPFGTKSKQSLSDLCFGKQAEIIPFAKDRYKRTVARVKCTGTGGWCHLSCSVLLSIFVQQFPLIPAAACLSQDPNDCITPCSFQSILLIIAGSQCTGDTNVSPISSTV